MIKVFPNITKDKIQQILSVKKAECNQSNCRIMSRAYVAFDCECCDHCMVEELVVNVPETMGGSKVAHGMLINRYVCDNLECDHTNTFKFVRVEE